MQITTRIARRTGGGVVAIALAGSALALTGGSAYADTTSPTLTANQPPLAVVHTGTGSEAANGPISPITLANDSASGPLVFTMSGHASFDVTHPVTVTVTAGDATIAASADGTFGQTATVTPTATTVTVYVKPGTQPSTYQVSDILAIATDAGLAQVSVNDGSATYGPVTATAAVGAVRLAGSDRYGTAATLFTDAFSCTETSNKGTAGDGTSTVVIARGDSFPDALSGNYAAGEIGTGILLTRPTAVPSATLAALKTAGVTEVVIVGGTGAVSTAVENTLKATEAVGCTGDTGKKLDVVRLDGANRYETAAVVAESLGTDDSGSPTYVGTAAYDNATTAKRTAIIATGANFPDALAAGPMAYWGDNLKTRGNGYGFPLLLTPTSSLAPSTKLALTDLKIQQVIIVGGTGAVSSAVESQIQAIVGSGNVLRLAGANRTMTARLVAEFETSGSDTQNSGLGYPTVEVALARGDAFPDALAGGPWAGSLPDPILLTSSPTALGTATHDYLAAKTADITQSLVVFGGTGAVTDATLQAAANALTGA